MDVAFAWLLAAVLVAQWWVLRRGLRRLPQLADVPAGDEPPPALSVVVAARDEAHTLEPALRSLLALDHPALQVVAVDDRSTDGTGALLDALAAEDPRLQVVHVGSLPEGWLGKTHALHLGAQRASGAWLLFTDADVHFAPDALRRALAHAQRGRLDHLVVLAELHVHDPLLAALLLDSYVLFYAAMPPWRVAGSPRVYTGMGAFNLVRATAYHAMGGHAALRLDVVDDIQLGKRLKLAGGRADVLLGRGAVSLEWYPDARDFVRGLEKNAFAAVDYSVAQALASTAVVLLLRVVPMLGLLLAGGWARAGYAVACAAWVGMHLAVRRTTRWDAAGWRWWPLAPLLMLGVLWRSVAITLRQGGIAWRGTRYPLAQLRAWRRAQRR